ncbi:MAG: undecaprenyl/decaprenyl-phosphate alpha-N-acetylglucosaminyl 1-phosphate transferase [Nitrospinae bacterium]|nr:undecaprenyl/decaprenyl-phosphate alpha-N-acetylglucosaminyl 1-phosphate transferase [Nitrospinota bacterium]
MISFILLLIITAFLSFCFTPITIKLSEKFEVYDAPGQRKVHKKATPLLGGLALFFSFWMGVFICSLFNANFHEFLYHETTLGLFLGSFVIVGIGVYDDVRGASPSIKLIFQGIAAIILVSFGFGVNIITNPFTGGDFQLGNFTIPFAIIWIIAITNAFNLIDGLDGLAAGIGFIVSMTAFLIAFHMHHHYTLIVSIALAGSILGFLKYNSHPAQTFLGDNGSFFIGFLIAAYSLKDSQKSATAVAILVPLIALGLPLMDTILAVIRRYVNSFEEKSVIKKFKHIVSADREHIHHKLMDLGYSHKTSVYILYIICIIFGGMAYLISVMNDEYIAFLLFFVSVLIFIGVRRLGYIEFKTLGKKKNGDKLPDSENQESQ